MAKKKVEAKTKTRKVAKSQKKPVVDSVVGSEVAPEVAPEVEKQPQAKRQPEPQPEKQPQATCPVCSQAVPRNQLLKHMWDRHHDYMIVQSSRGGRARKGQQPPEPKATTPKAPAKPPAKAKGLETVLPEGESVTGYDESEHPPTTEKPKTPEGEEKKKPKVEGVSDEFIEGTALWIKAQVSMKTMAYYELAVSRVRGDNNTQLSLGDFIDICVDDYFKGRGEELGIVYAEKKEVVMDEGRIRQIAKEVLKGGING